MLQEKVFEPLGSVEPIEMKARVIAATNRDLRKLVKKGSFREDLYYRVDVVRLELPELRDRREDIPLLVEHFITHFNRLQGKDVVGLSTEAMALLLEHDYPGNVRELENTIEHAFVLCRAGLIEARHLPARIRQRAGPPAAGEPAPRGAVTLQAIEVALIADALRRHAGNRKAAAQELGIHPSTLFRKVKALGIELPEQDGRARHGGN